VAVSIGVLEWAPCLVLAGLYLVMMLFSCRERITGVRGRRWKSVFTGDDQHKDENEETENLVISLLCILAYNQFSDNNSFEASDPFRTGSR